MNRPVDPSKELGAAKPFAVTTGGLPASLKIHSAPPKTWGDWEHLRVPFREIVTCEGPFVVYDYEPGIVIRTYWLPPWAGRHYHPSGGKLPVLGRREQITPASVSGKRSWRRERSSFPVDTIQQPPFFLNQQQYFPSSESAPPPTVSK